MINNNYNDDNNINDNNNNLFIYEGNDCLFLTKEIN